MITKEKALEIINIAKGSHENWLTYLSNHKSFPTQNVGDIAHHRRYICAYNQVIEYLTKTYTH